MDPTDQPEPTLPPAEQVWQSSSLSIPSSRCETTHSEIILDTAEAARKARWLKYHTINPENNIRILLDGPTPRTIVFLLAS